MVMYSICELHVCDSEESFRDMLTKDLMGLSAYVADGDASLPNVHHYRSE